MKILISPSEDKWKKNKMSKKITKNWEEVDERCPTCNQITKRVRGITKQNINNLFRMPTLNETIILVMMLGCLILAWAYNKDTSVMRELINDPSELCTIYFQNLAIQPGSGISGNKFIFNPNLSNNQNG